MWRSIEHVVFDAFGLQEGFPYMLPSQRPIVRPMIAETGPQNPEFVVQRY